MSAVTPPMGWNAWNYFGWRDINEENIRAVADAMVEKGYRDVGHTYVCVEDVWMSRGRDENGDLIANP